MLNWSLVIKRVKEELSLPFQTLEKSDEDIVEYLKGSALVTFTQYFPQKWRMTLNCADDRVKVPGRTSEFYLIDPDDREIIDVVDFIPNLSPSLMNNHPWLGSFSYGEALENWHLNVFKANNLKPFSNFNYTTEYIPPNQLRISPKFNSRCVIEYSRTHDPELSTINPNLHSTFINLSIGTTMMMIGRIRQKYSSYNTPFGEINLNGDLLLQEGKEIYDKAVEEMKNGSLPNVTFHAG